MISRPIVPAPGAIACIYRFDVFELDTRAGELRKNGIRLRLQGQPLQVLAILLQHAGELVTREELRSQIWTADTFVDFDHSLHNAIARLREVMGDCADSPSYIETLPRRGYRFIGSVEEIGTPAPAIVAAREPVSEAPSIVQRRKSLTWSLIGLLALVSIGVGLWVLSHRAMANPPLRSIAVLPLENLSGDPSQEYFVDGMTDELITDLAKVGALRVTSRTSVMRYKGAKKSLPEIARELNVDGIIEGSVVRSGNRVRITAQLLNGPTDRHLWAETYDRNLGDVLKLQSEVAEAIAQQVRVQLTPQQQARLRSAHPVDPEAYEAYVRGRYYFTNEFTNPEKLKLAKSYFEDSIRRDPGFAQAYAGLADSYVYLATFAPSEMPPGLAYKSAKEALRKALELDGTVGETYDTLGSLSWLFERNWNTAEQNFSRSIALAPSYSCAHEDHALFLAFSGRRAEALAEMAKSDQLDPGPGSTMVESGVYFQLRDYPSLVAASQRGVVSNPNEWTEHQYLGMGYEATGRGVEAISEYQRAVELSDGNLDAIASLAHAFAVTGRPDEARKILRGLEQKSKTVYVSPYVLATIYAGLGDNNQAFELLEKAFQERALDLSWSLKADLRLDTLRSDPRFQTLLQRMGFAGQTTRAQITVVQ